MDIIIMSVVAFVTFIVLFWRSRSIKNDEENERKNRKVYACTGFERNPQTGELDMKNSRLIGEEEVSNKEGVDDFWCNCSHGASRNLRTGTRCSKCGGVIFND